LAPPVAMPAFKARAVSDGIQHQAVVSWPVRVHHPIAKGVRDERPGPAARGRWPRAPPDP
jgi:hypothetical protein